MIYLVGYRLSPREIVKDQFTQPGVRMLLIYHGWSVSGAWALPQQEVPPAGPLAPNGRRASDGEVAGRVPWRGDSDYLVKWCRASSSFSVSEALSLLEKKKKKSPPTVRTVHWRIPVLITKSPFSHRSQVSTLLTGNKETSYLPGKKNSNFHSSN